MAYSPGLIVFIMRIRDRNLLSMIFKRNKMGFGFSKMFITGNSAVSEIENPENYEGAYNLLFKSIYLEVFYT